MDSGSLGNTPQMFQVDMDKISRAFAKLGARAKLYNAPTETEYKYLTRKGLTVLQWRLRELYKLMFDEELAIRRTESELLGGKQVQHVGSLRTRMNNNYEVAEEVFAHWASRLGINHLYAESLCADPSNCHEILHRNYHNSSGILIYDRFDRLLKRLC